jgi:hypothetical protein
MKKKMIQPAMAATIAIMLSACTHYYYAPNTSNIPLFKEKNTMKINGGYSSGDNYNGADVQLAYSVNSKIGVMFNSFFAGNTEDVENNSGYYHTESGKGSLFEIGAGYYKPFGDQNKWTFETYVGAGAGTENHSYEGNQKAKLNLRRYFVQPSIGYNSSNGLLEVALGSRFCDLKLKVKEHNVTATGGANDTNKRDLDNISLFPSSALWEPTVRLAMGWNNFKFYLQLTSSQNLSNMSLPQDHSNFNIGIKFTIK